jgi:hypothetical protein
VSVIVGSLLLILVAVVMFGLGLVRGSNAFLVASIAASLFAAILVVLGARRAAAARAALGRAAPGRDTADGLDGESAGPRSAGASGDRPREAVRRRGDGTVYGRDTAHGVDASTDVLVEEQPEHVSIPGQATGGRHIELDLEEDTDDEDPPDEPAAQLVTPADAERVARMSAEVLVIDGRPRYHQAGCVHLLGRESEPLPVSEAVELGFTPCSLCEPDSALLAEARRV